MLDGPLESVSTISSRRDFLLLTSFVTATLLPKRTDSHSSYLSYCKSTTKVLCKKMYGGGGGGDCIQRTEEEESVLCVRLGCGPSIKVSRLAGGWQAGGRQVAQCGIVPAPPNACTCACQATDRPPRAIPSQPVQLEQVRGGKEGRSECPHFTPSLLRGIFYYYTLSLVFFHLSLVQNAPISSQLSSNQY